MKLTIKQTLFSFVNPFKIYDEHGNLLYKVKSKCNLKRCMYVYDLNENCVAKIEEEPLKFLPKYKGYIDGNCIGELKREGKFFRKGFIVSDKDWHILSEKFKFNYKVIKNNQTIIDMKKNKTFGSDTFHLNISDEEEFLTAVLAILGIIDIVLQELATLILTIVIINMLVFSVIYF